MTMGSQSVQLLFFDTFSHGIVEELNLDLVQFPNPVIVEEVRVIPLGAKVQANFPGGLRLGATNPAQFNLEFFVNDLSRSGASTFERLGTLQCGHDGRIHMETDKKIPTDGLVLRGFYNAITLAVYGTLSKYTAEQLALQSSVRPHPDNPPTGQTVEQVAAVKETASVKDSVYQNEKVIKVEPASVKATEPWHYGDQHLTSGKQTPPLPQVVIDSKNDILPARKSSLSPDKNTYHRSDRSYKDRDCYDDRRSRGGSRGRDRRDWKRSDSMERWQSDRHRSRRSRDRSRDRSRSPIPAWEHERYRRSRSPSSLRSPASRRSRSPSLPKQPPRIKSPVRQTRNSISPARSRHSRTRSRSPIAPPVHPQPVVVEVKSPVNDVLDGVSGISDGDIPDIAEVEEPVEKFEPPESAEADFESETALTDLKRPTRPEDIEEISGGGAEWSDEGDPIYPMGFDVDFGVDWEYPVKEFDYFSVDVKPPTYFTRLEGKGRQIFDHSVVEEKVNLLITLQELAPSSDWVEAIEQLTAVLTVIGNNDSWQDLFVKAALKGLDLQASISQPLPAFKLRHLKSGLKFTLALFEAGGKVAEVLLEKDVQKTLLSLFDEPHMAVSLKLLILRIFDSCINSLNGMNRFLGRHISRPTGKSVFATLVERLSNPKTGLRLKCALSALVSKVSLFEVLETVSSLVEDVEKANCDQLPMSLTNTLCDCLDQLVEFFVKGPFLIGQPQKYLPTRSHYELKDSLFYDHITGYLLLWDSTQTLTNLNRLLSSNNVNSEIVDKIVSLLAKIGKEKSGLVYLTSNAQETSLLLKTLLSIGHLSLFSQFMITTLTAFSCIDQLNSLCQGKPRKEMESLQVLEVIQTLRGLTLNNQAKLALIGLIAKTDFLDILIQLIQHSPQADEGEPKRDMKKSAIRAYASELILLVVRCSSDVDYLKKFATTLINVGAQDEASRLYELTQWLGPFTNTQIFTPDGIQLLGEIIIKNSDKLSPMSSELMTAVRTLNMLCAEPKHMKLDNDIEEQKYKIVLMAFYSQNLLDQYFQILTKISGFHEQPQLHLVTFFGNSGFMLMGTIFPMVRTIKNILRHLIKCQRSGYKDVTPVRALLKIYALCQAVGPSAVSYSISRKVSQDIITILSYYTLSSVWQEMVKEVFKFMQEAPHTFVPGLDILSQLLPPPLPMQTQSPLSSNELERIDTIRNLWSVHIYTMEATICQVIEMLCGTSVGPLQNSLQRVCMQLSDLSAATACFVVKAVLDRLKKTIHDNVMVAERTLEFLQTLLDQATTKTAFLLVTLEKEYQDVPSLLCQVLSTEVGHPWNENVQETVACAVRSLLDPEISLQVIPDPITESHLANAIPSKDQFVTYLGALVDHLALNSSGPCLAPVFRTLAMANDYEFGQFQQRTLFKSKPTLLAEFCTKFGANFCKDNQDQVQCLSAMTMFFQSLVSDVDKSKMDLGEIFQIQDESVNPVEVLVQKVIEVNSSNEESRDILQSVTETLEAFAKMVSEANEGPVDVKNNFDEELKLPEPETLLKQFQQRQVFIECDGPLDNWFFAPPSRSDEKDFDQTQTTSVDLIELAESLLPDDFNLFSEVQKVCSERLSETRKKKNKKSVLEARALKNKNLISNFKSGGPVPNICGTSRGFPRSGQRMDAFRSRPPNTSRPPSLHVDDFIVLQSRGQQPTGPTGYNKQTLKAAQGLFAQREAKKGAIGYREATREPVFTGNMRGMPEGRGNGRPPVGMGPSKMMPYRGHRPRGVFNRDRLMPRDWSSSNRGRPQNDFQGGRPRPGMPNKMRGGPRDDRPRHIRSSMDR